MRLININKSFRNIFFKQTNLVIFLGLILSTLFFITRINFASSGLDQWDVVLYKNSLESMTYFREAKWPFLLMIQKIFWLFFPTLSASKVLSTINVLFGSATIFFTFHIAYTISNSILLSILSFIIIFVSPIYNVYSIIGMQDIPQTFFVVLTSYFLIQGIKFRKKYYFYLVVFLFGLSLGIRLTLLLLLPTMFLSFATCKLRWRTRDFILILVLLLSSISLWTLYDLLFINEMKNANGWQFFINQVKYFNVLKEGFFNKMSSYPLFTGYPFSLFYRLPFLLYFFYILYTGVLIKRKISYSIFYNYIFLLFLSITAISLYLRFRNTKVEYFYLYIFFIFTSSVIQLFFVFRKSKGNIIQKIYSYLLLEKKDQHILFSLIGIYFFFNFLFTGAVARYLLPILPFVVILLMIQFSKLPLFNKYEKTKFFPAVILFFLIYFSFPYGKTLSVLNNFHKLDTRSSVAKFIKSKKGVYFDFTPGGLGLSTYLDSYGVNKKIKNLTNNDYCKNTPSEFYIITYGNLINEINQNFKTCIKEIKEVTKYQRDEIVIEDSVGNIGFYIYKVKINEN